VELDLESARIRVVWLKADKHATRRRKLIMHILASVASVNLKVTILRLRIFLLRTSLRVAEYMR
jgi:hypothetical protein